VANYSQQPHAKTNEEQVNVSTTAIESNQEKEVNTKEIVGDKQPVCQASSRLLYLAYTYFQDLTFLPKSILRDQPTAEPTFKVSVAVKALVKASSIFMIRSNRVCKPAMKSPLKSKINLVRILCPLRMPARLLPKF